MAEQFLEEIYEDAKLLCALKQIVEWTKVQDEHHVMLKFEEIKAELLRVCQSYAAQDMIKAQNLWSAIQEVTKINGDLLLMGDLLEHVVLPLLEEYMERWGQIVLDNEEGDFRFETTVSGFLTIKNIQRNIYYHSTVDPMWEARKLAEYIFDPKKDSYSIWGCGLGYLPYQLYLVSNGSVKINVFEEDARMIEYARSYGVLDWIPEDCLDVIVDEDILPFLYSLDKENVGYHVSAPQYRGASKEVHAALDAMYIENSTAKKFDKYTAINFWRNIRSDSKLVSEFDTSQLKKEYLVIAAGPSLDDNLDFIRESKGEKTLIAVGTVFKKLIANDIIPDMVVLLDPQERTYKHIEGLENQNVPLLISMAAYWKFAAAYQGEKYLVPMGQCYEIRDYAIEHKMPMWSCGGTVTAMAMECAIQFGAEKIYLVGVDLAYPNGVSHASGTMDRTVKSLNSLIPVEGVGHQTVYTTAAFIHYRKWMEERIAQTPQISYYNLSRVGIKIAGAMEVHGEADNAEEWNPTAILERPQRFLYVSQQFATQEWEQIWAETRKLENDRDKLIIWLECLRHIEDNLLYEEYLTLLQETEALNWDEKYYLMWQIVSMLFSMMGAETPVITQMIYKLYHEISEKFMQELEPMETLENRNDDLVVVTVQQFLNLMHAPTKTALDRARVLKNKLGKRVMIVNTAEMYGGCEVKLLRRNISSYIPEYLDRDMMEYEGEKYPFMQFEQNMPNLSSIREFLAFIKKHKPAYIVNIGGDSLLADASARLVPVLNVNTVFSKVARSEATMQTMGRELTAEDDALLNILGKNRNDVISGRFTFPLKPQDRHFTKADLGIPDDKFVLVAIGGRLTTEISEEFVRMIDKVLDAGAVLVIMGKMNTYDEMCEKDSIFKQNSVYLGMQEDVLAILDHCELYVNPERKGGGSSVIEAMYKGCPAVTLRGGDVEVSAGEVFCVDNYASMQAQILRYMSDARFYAEMSEKAKERAEYMLDSDTAFIEIIEAFEKKYLTESTGV